MTTPGRDTSVHVRLFGDAAVENGGGRVPLTPRQLALVTLVYGHGANGLTRPAAAGLLWDSAPANRARQRIRQLLVETRKRVGHQIIDTPADSLRPAPGVSCDFMKFEAALQAGALQEAAALAGQGFIPGVLEKADTFSDWRHARATRLLREVRSRAFTRWSQAFERGAWPEAREAAEALYLLDPDDPQVVERVIQARGRVGETQAAEEAFATYVSSLRPGVEAATPILQTIETVRAAVRAMAASSKPGESRVRFIGRQEALASARRGLDSLGQAHFELVLISGESGIGKTRLLDEIHREAILREFRCLRAQLVELERGIPLNPVLDALCQVADLEQHLAALGQPWSSVIAGLLPPGTFDHPPAEPPPIQASSLSRRLLDSFALLFEHLAREQSTVLFIDDLQWADDTTVATLQFLQRRWSKGSFGIFATVRPDLVRATDPVAKYLSGSADLGARRIELPALSSSEALELVRTISGGAIDEPRAHRLSAIAGHHPLYLTELTRDFLAGRLRLPERRSDPVAIPSSLGQMLDARLHAMDERATRVAGVLAVAARPLHVSDVATLADLTLEDAATAVETLIRARFVEIDRNHVQIPHDLFRSAVYRQLSSPRRAVHHRAIAEHLLSQSPDEHAAELATHFALAGEDELAAAHGWIAAKRALEAGALAEAIQSFEVIADKERDPVRQADASAELARALHLSRDITKANPQLSLAAERLRSTGRPHAARRLEIRRIEGLAEVDAASVEELLRWLAPIKAGARDSYDWESVALALDAELHLLHRKGDVQGIRLLLREMREVATKEPVEARLLSYSGLALGVFFDDPDEALVAARTAVELSDSGGPYRLWALNRLLVVLQARGMVTLPDAARWVTEARTLSECSGDLMLRFSIESNIAVAHLDAGDLETAEALMARARAIPGAGEMDINRFVQANNEAELALALADYQGAADAFSRASSYLGLTTPRYMQDLVNAGLGFCALQTGNLSEAREREGLLKSPPDSWYFDPTTILTFRSKLLERQGRHLDALQLLKDGASNLKGRMPLAWLKVVLLQARLLAKHSPEDAVRLSVEMSREAQRLALPRRAQDFSDLVTGLTS